jgi:hypothetical protein
MPKRKGLSRLAEKALREHRERLREAGLEWQTRLAKDGPYQDSSAGVLEWMQARQAEQAAMDSAVAGALRRSPGRPAKNRERNIDMALQYLQRKQYYLARKQRPPSDSRLKELIGKQVKPRPLSRRAAIDAINAGLKIINQKTVR